MPIIRLQRPHLAWIQCKDYSSSASPKRPSNLKGRKPDQQRWLIRQFKDPYVIRARETNYRARSAFKLIEIDDRYHIFRPGCRVVDCGAAPGAWTQVAVERTNNQKGKERSKGIVVAVDKLFMLQVDGAFILHSRDFTDAGTQKEICQHFLTNSPPSTSAGIVDVVLSDMAPSATGNKDCDHERIIQLCYEAFLFAVRHLTKGGSFLTKLWEGGLRSKLSSDMEKHFRRVDAVKPDASRDDSAEMFLLGREFKGLQQN